MIKLILKYHLPNLWDHISLNLLKHSFLGFFFFFFLVPVLGEQTVVNQIGSKNLIVEV